MYSISEIKKGIRNPELARREIRSRLYPILHPVRASKSKWVDRVQRRTYARSGYDYNPDGVDVFEEDWDNLILLDACRYDEFEDACTLPGELEHRVSRGSTSNEFVRGNFTGRTLNDVVYVSDNQWYAKLKDDIDAEIHDFVSAPVDGDAHGGLVNHPSTVTEIARNTAEAYPDKRLIVHYLQPHSPYFSSDGEELFRVPSLSNLRDSQPPFARNRSRREVIEAYRSTLELVLHHAGELIGSLTGKTVISADHGEMLGERAPGIPFRIYDHPGAVYAEQLVKVPWFVHDFDERKEILAEESDNDVGVDDDAIESKLRALGYRL